MVVSKSIFGKSSPQTWSTKHLANLKTGHKPITHYVEPEKVDKFIKGKIWNCYDLLEKELMKTGAKKGLYKVVVEFNQ